MSRGHLGNKFTCEECGTKFYDLNKTPAICPKCGSTNERTQTLSPKKIDSSSEPKSGSKNDTNLKNDGAKLAEINEPDIDPDIDIEVDIEDDTDDDILGESDPTEEEDALEGVITKIKNDEDS